MKIKLQNGREVEVVDIDFDTVAERWNEYKLEDGTILKFKAVITSVIRTEDYDPMTGDPIYHVHSTSILRAKVPQKLKHLSSDKSREGVEVR